MRKFLPSRGSTNQPKKALNKVPRHQDKSKAEDDRSRAHRHYNAGRYEDAEHYYGRLIRPSKDADGKVKLIAGTRQWLLTDPEALEDWLLLAETLYRQEKRGEAESILRQLAFGRKEISDYFSGDIKSSDRAVSARATARLAAVQQILYKVEHLLVWALTRQHKVEALDVLAGKWFDEYKINHDNDNSRNIVSLADALRVSSAFTKAEEILRYALNERGRLNKYERHHAYVVLGATLKGQKRWSEAEEALVKAGEYKSEDRVDEVERLNDLSECLLRQRRYDEAETHSRMALELGRRSSSIKMTFDTAKALNKHVVLAQDRIEEISARRPPPLPRWYPRNESILKQRKRRETSVPGIPSSSRWDGPRRKLISDESDSESSEHNSEAVDETTDRRPAAMSGISTSTKSNANHPENHNWTSQPPSQPRTYDRFEHFPQRPSPRMQLSDDEISEPFEADSWEVRPNLDGGTTSPGSGTSLYTTYPPTYPPTPSPPSLPSPPSPPPASSLPRQAQTLARKPVSNASSRPVDDITRAAAARIAILLQEHDATRPLTDAQILQISSMLKHADPPYSKVPRTYVVLRQMECLHLIDEVLSRGFSDFHFPATASNVPPCLSPRQRTAFLKTQGFVLTSSLELEHGGHHYFQDDETVPFQRLTILGAGGFGEVDKVLSLTTFKEYARKRVPRSMIFANKRQAEMVTQLVAEITVLKRLKHHHVVDLIGSYTDPQYMGLIMTPIANMDLSTYLANASSSNHHELRTFFGCLAYALKYLHGQNVRHKDIKPSNVLVYQGSVLLTDFGLSFDFSDFTQSTTVSMVNGMSRPYCAPEVAEYQPRNTSSDIWSLGIVFLEILVTLKGRTIESMRAYFREHGTGEEYIRENHGTLAGYIELLKTAGQASDDFMIVWIVWMLDMVKEDRPTAAQLVGSMAGAPRAEGAPRFCGLCCSVPNGWH